MSENSLKPAVAEAITEDVTHKTLFIGGWFSTCGCCRKNASYDEKSHKNAFQDGEGCGITWEYVSSDESTKEEVQPMRPDLIWREPKADHIGITFATEVVALSGLEAIVVDKSGNPLS